MNLGELRSAVLARLSLNSDDPSADAVDDLINEAVQMVAVANGAGWDWLREPMTVTLTAGTSRYTFASLSTTTTITQVLSAKVLTDSRYKSLEVTAPDEADNTYISSNITNTPESYWVEGQAITFYPTPSAASTVVLRVVDGEPTLTSDTESPLLPVRYHSAIIAGALVAYYETLQDTARSQAAAQRFDGWIKQMQEAQSPIGQLPRVRLRRG